MRCSRQKRNIVAPHSERGYSLLEVLIAMQLGILVIGLALWSYSFSNKVILGWQDKNSKVMEAAAIEKALQISLNRYVFFHKAEEKILIGRTANQDTLHINLTANSVRINGKVVCKASGMMFRYYYLLGDELMEMPSVPSGKLNTICAIKISGAILINEDSQPLFILKRIIWGQTQAKSGIYQQM